MARTKDVILTPEQKEQMEKEYFEALKPMESVNATRNHSQYDEFLLLFIFWSTVTLYAQLLKQNSYIDTSKKNALIKTAKNMERYKYPIGCHFG